MPQAKKQRTYVGEEVVIAFPNGVREEVVVLDIDNEAGLFLAEGEDSGARWVALSRIVR